MYWACAHERTLEHVKLLIDNGAKIPTNCKWNRNPMYAACSNDNLEGLKLLFKVIDEQSKTKAFYDCLYWACYDGAVEIVKFLISEKLDLNYVNVEEKIHASPLHCAALSSNEGVSTDKCLKILNMLLKAGANVNSFDEADMTPLMKMLHHEHRAEDRIWIIKFLIQNGADVNIVNKDGKTALDMALYSYSDDYFRPEDLNHVSFLICKGAKTKTPPDKNFNILKYDIFEEEAHDRVNNPSDLNKINEAIQNPVICKEKLVIEEKYLYIFKILLEEKIESESKLLIELFNSTYNNAQKIPFIEIAENCSLDKYLDKYLKEIFDIKGDKSLPELTYFFSNDTVDFSLKYLILQMDTLNKAKNDPTKHDSLVILDYYIPQEILLALIAKFNDFPFNQGDQISSIIRDINWILTKCQPNEGTKSALENLLKNPTLHTMKIVEEIFVCDNQSESTDMLGKCKEENEDGNDL